MSTGFLIEPSPDVVIISQDDTPGPIPVITPDVTPVQLDGGETKIVTAAEGPMGPQGDQGIPGPPGADGITPDLNDVSLNGGNF